MAKWMAFTLEPVQLTAKPFPKGCKDGVLPADLAVIADAQDLNNFDCEVAFEGVTCRFPATRSQLKLIGRL